MRLVLNYRIDKDNKIWLLSCSSLRVDEDKNTLKATKIYKPVYDVNKILNVYIYI